MKKEGDIKRRYQHPDAVSYTPECKDGLMLLIKPSFFLQIYGASALSHRQNYTSVYSFDCDNAEDAPYIFKKTLSKKTSVSFCKETV